MCDIFVDNATGLNKWFFNFIFLRIVLGLFVAFVYVLGCMKFCMLGPYVSFLCELASVCV